MAKTDKFDISIESDNGKTEILEYLKKNDIFFNSRDETRILERMRFVARKYELKSYLELLDNFKSDPDIFRDAVDWLKRGKVYDENVAKFHPLINRVTTLKDFTQVTEKKKPQKKVRKPSVFIPEFKSPFRDPKDPQNFELVLNILTENKINYGAYKDKYLIRRIHVRMRRLDLETYREYAEFMKKNPSEINQLQDSLSINVTRFFRDKEMYDVLQKIVLPDVFRTTEGKIKIWSAGCAVGAEPYSIAMIIDQCFDLRDKRRVEILATDISYELLSKAKTGLYYKELLQETPPTETQKYFQKRGENYQISQILKQYIDFQAHDLRNPPPSSGFDLILCRNVLIYFSQEQTEKLFERMHKALKPNGYLILGKCEMMRGETRKEFEIIDSRNRIYKKI